MNQIAVLLLIARFQITLLVSICKVTNTSNFNSKNNAAPKWEAMIFTK